MNLSSVNDKVTDFFAARRKLDSELRDREKLMVYCDERNIHGVQRSACLDVFGNRGLAEATATADRITAQMRAIRTRFDTQPDSAA